MRCFDIILYHGTTEEAAQKIIKEGLKPTYLGNSIICMAPSPEVARNFGGVILKIDTSGYNISCFEDCEEWERFVWTDVPIPPERICIMEATD